MKPFIVSMDSDLEEVGGTRMLKGTLDETSYHVGVDEYKTPEGVAYDLILTNTGEGILLSGLVKCTAQTRCARCLDPVELDIAGEVEGYYLLEPAEKVEGYEEDEFEVIDDEGNFDIAGPLEAALVFDTPYVTLCKDDCKGLCPHCGKNLNEGPCDCPPDDGIDEMNPFAVLKNLDLGQSDN